MSSNYNNNFVYIKNAFVLEEQAVVSVRERGFRFGDGVFETIRVVGGVPYQWDLHMERLAGGLSVLHIEADIAALRGIGQELMTRNGLKDGFLRLSISRGQGSIGYLPEITDGPTIVMETIEGLPEPLAPLALVVSSYQHIPPHCLPSEAKTMQGLQSTLARLEAKAKGCFEALLTSQKGYICEGSSANIFWLAGGVLYTPSLALGVKPGTVRDAVIRLSPYEVVQGAFGLEELLQAEEVFMTNVAWLVAPVQSLQPQGFLWERFEACQTIRRLILDDALTTNA